MIERVTKHILYYVPTTQACSRVLDLLDMNPRLKSEFDYRNINYLIARNRSEELKQLGIKSVPTIVSQGTLYKDKEVLQFINDRADAKVAQMIPQIKRRLPSHQNDSSALSVSREEVDNLKRQVDSLKMQVETLRGQLDHVTRSLEFNRAPLIVSSHSNDIQPSIPKYVQSSAEYEVQIGQNNAQTLKPLPIEHRKDRPSVEEILERRKLLETKRRDHETSRSEP